MLYNFVQLLWENKKCPKPFVHKGVKHHFRMPQTGIEPFQTITTTNRKGI